MSTMAATRYNPPDMRRQVGSPRPKTRDSRDTMCRNVLIYGHCRYEDTCAFNHDQTKPSGSDLASKKTLNVESPSFTPASLQPLKKPTFSSQSARSAVFTPKGSEAATPAPPPEAEQVLFNPATIREFTPQPQNFDLATPNGAGSDNGNPYDPFSMATVGQSLPSTQFNPYANDQSNIGGAGSGYYQGQPGYSAPLQPLNYHLYFPMPPHRRQDLAPYQRLAHDFFMPEKLREDIQKKSQAALQVMPNSVALDNYHSLVILDTRDRKMGGLYGHVSWLYKAVSLKDGKTYCLRRLENYRLTNAEAIQTVKKWKGINNGNIVSVHDAFTTRGFGDSSLVFAQDYLPSSRTLAEHYFPSTTHAGRYRPSPLKADELWGFIVQISNALKAIHSNKLAARCLDPTKIIMTDKHRIRLSGCAILDVINYEGGRPIAELQQEDFVLFGRLVLCLVTNTPPSQLHNVGSAMEHLAKMYPPDLKDLVAWLLQPPRPEAPKLIEQLISGISQRIVDSFDSSLHTSDSLYSELFREVENGRIARLVMKLGTINEREEFSGDSKWAEHGERYMLKLFRDYVFHQVDENGNPVLDMGHMLRNMAKLDAATSEMIRLTSRNGDNDFIVSYKELNKAVATAFGDLSKASRQGSGGFS